jgi:hypothetical protein
MNSEDETLRKVLGQWQVAQPLPPRFQERVWSRIEQAAATPTAWQFWQRWLEGAFASRTAATAYVTALLLAGVAAGYVNGQAHQQRWKTQQAAQYVHDLDPYR